MKKQQGFTLLEILVAVTITGILVTVVFSFFNQSFSTWEAVDVHSSWQQQWRILEAELTTDVHTIFLSPLTSNNLFQGQPQRVKWYRMEQGALQQVIYAFDSQQNELIKKVLAVRNDEVIKKLKFFTEFELTEVKFSFNHSELGYWKENWNYQNKNYLPAVIKLELKAKEVQIPPLVIENFIGRKYGGR